MLIALTIVWLSGGGAGSWFFPEDFSDRIETVVVEENRQSEIIDLFDQINESIKTSNEEMKDLAKNISDLNRNPETTEKELEGVLQQILQERKSVQTEIVEARLKMTGKMKPDEWQRLFAEISPEDDTQQN